MKKLANNYKTFTLICLICKENFKGRINQLYCNSKCRKKYYGFIPEFKDISAGSVGAIQELRVCTDLMTKGFEVFRSVSPSCSCDIIIHKNNIIKKVEVRTAYRSGTGYLGFTTHGIKANILALVLQNGEIEYKQGFKPYKSLGEVKSWIS